MTVTSQLIALGLLVGAVTLAVTVLKAKLGGGAAGEKAKFKARQLLTPNETEFLSRLEGAAPELRFFAQVAMGALIEPAVPRSDRTAYYRARGAFSQKIVDFVALSRTDGSVVAVIELDDRTHNSDKDGRRDDMLKSAGYRIVRWDSRSKPDAPAIRVALLPPSNSAAERVRR